MENIITEVLTNLLILLVNIGIGYVVAFLRKHKILTEIKSFEGLAEIAVKGVEQSFKDANGEQKFLYAKEWLIKVAKEKGIRISESQIDLVIEAVVKDVKVKFGEVAKEVEK